MKPFVLWEGEISPEGCDQLIEDCKKYELTEAVVGAGQVNESVRKSKVRWVSKFDKINNFLMEYFTLANRDFGFDIRSVFEIQFTEYYGSENSHFDWHQDVAWNVSWEMQRKITLVVQLSDPSEYEGGGFEMHEQGLLEGFRKRGSILAFPAFTHHRVTPVTKGTRLSLVSWCEGLRWR